MPGFGQRSRRSAVETAFHKASGRISTLVDGNPLLRYLVLHDHARSETFSCAAWLSEISGNTSCVKPYFSPGDLLASVTA